MAIAQVQQGDLRAAWKEIERLWEETRLLRQKIATGWELGVLEYRACGVAVYNDANISIPTGAWTTLTFNSERRDDADFHSTTSNTDRLTVPSGHDGWYMISSHARFAANSSGDARSLDLTVNGTYIGISGILTPSGNYAELSIATVYYLSAGDIVRTQVWQNSGGNLNVLAGGNYSPEFRMVRI